MYNTDNCEPHELFKAVYTCSSLEGLRQLANKCLPASYITDFEKKYPRIKFCLSKNEIGDLKQESICNDVIFRKDQSSYTALEKLLLAVLWKNGELNRISSVMKGVKNEDQHNKTGHIFYQFGKSLCNGLEPIVDRYTLTAYNYYMNGKKSFAELAKPQLIKDYVKWFQEKIIKLDETEKKEFSYLLDKILFYIGKDLASKRKTEVLAKRISSTL